ncbi:streptomycin biosynthesis protein [Streptomyces sp. NPDC002817]|uniref:ParB/RepB/Spo0J family partition protein n=1 Tax=Streptomyces sp. NPDC088357 TaxID=3154655 RepID=UPI003412C7EE
MSDLVLAESPRLDGENASHTRLLAQVEEGLPPILVDRSTMRVVDGVHRVQAAKLRGEDMISVCFVDGSDEELFLLAVRENISHGLPLSLSDREAAAQRILAVNPWWSDRAIAKASGIAAGTVRRLRQCSTAHPEQSNTRVGRDGRARPVSGEEGRRRTIAALSEHPQASLRVIARKAGVSVSTAHRVRTALAEQDDASAVSESGVSLADSTEFEGSVGTAAPSAGVDRDGRARGGDDAAWGSARQRLRNDPALKYSESGRALLRWLDVHAIEADEWKQLVEAVPAHWADVVAAIALNCSKEWQKIADELR